MGLLSRYESRGTSRGSGVSHHVTQRGNRRADVFETDADRQAYLRFLKRYAGRYGLAE